MKACIEIGCGQYTLHHVETLICRPNIGDNIQVTGYTFAVTDVTVRADDILVYCRNEPVKRYSAATLAEFKGKGWV